MEQHPVPQHIASYEFRLIGDMTLKQFAQLAAGGILAIVAYALPLHVIIKWPLVIFLAFLGFAFAFLPINERPLSIWFLAFLKAAFSPTQFIWTRKTKKPDLFRPTPQKIGMSQVQPEGPISEKQENINQYLTSLPYAEEDKNPLDKKEEEFLNEVDRLFQSTPQPQVAPATQPEIKPQPFRPKVDEEIVLPQKPKRPKKPTVEAKINKDLPIPEAPEKANIVVGMVLDDQGMIVEGAILEIRDTQGLPVRALKTNKVGQFLIATPLQDGQYEIEVEKEGLLFDVINLETKGKIIQPIEIRAKEKIEGGVSNPQIMN